MNKIIRSIRDIGFGEVIIPEMALGIVPGGIDADINDKQPRSRFLRTHLAEPHYVYMGHNA